jgi:hypothetical protein
MNRPTHHDADRLLVGLGCVTIGCLALIIILGVLIGFGIAQVLQ